MGGKKELSRFKGWTEKDILTLEHRSPGKELIEFKQKYKARRKEYNGIIYDSSFEAKYAFELDWRKKINDIKDWERQITFELKVNDVLICKYIIDFLIIHNGGKKEYIETKGFETKDWKIKRKLFQALYPELNYKIIKQKIK